MEIKITITPLTEKTFQTNVIFDKDISLGQAFSALEAASNGLQMAVNQFAINKGAKTMKQVQKAIKGIVVSDLDINY